MAVQIIQILWLKKIQKTMNMPMEIYGAFWCRSFRKPSLLAAYLSQVSDNCKQCRPVSHVNVILAIGLHYTVMSWQYGGGIERREEQLGEGTVYSNPHCLLVNCEETISWVERLLAFEVIIEQSNNIHTVFIITV